MVIDQSYAPAEPRLTLPATGMDTKSQPARERIRHILSVLSADPLTAESDLFHEFGLTVPEAHSLVQKPPKDRATPRIRSRFA